MESVADQLSAFTVMFAGGMAIGLVFDFYRLFRLVVRAKGVLDWFFDFLFWAVTAPVLVIIMFYGNWGELRLYVLIAVSLGATFYFRVLSRPVRGVLRSVARLTGAVIRWTGRGVKRTVLDPVLWLWDQGVAALDRRAEHHHDRANQNADHAVNGGGSMSGNDDGS